MAAELLARGGGGQSTPFELQPQPRRPTPSNNCHLLSPFVCTNRSAMMFLSLLLSVSATGQVFQNHREKRGTAIKGIYG